MAISKKPILKKVDVEEIINRGGTIATNNIRKKSSKDRIRKSILIKLFQETLEKIDIVLESRPIKTTRQRWIEEAILEKLKKI